MRKIIYLIILAAFFQGNNGFSQKTSSEFEIRTQIKNYLLEFIDHADLVSGNATGRMAIARNAEDIMVRPFLGYFGIDQLDPSGDQQVEETILNFMNEEIRLKVRQALKEGLSGQELYNRIIALDNILITPYEYWRMFWYEDENNKEPRINSKIWFNAPEIVISEYDKRIAGKRFQRTIDCIIHTTSRFTDFSSGVPVRGTPNSMDFEARIYINYTKQKGVVSDFSIARILPRSPFVDTVQQSNFTSKLEISSYSGIPTNLINIVALQEAQSSGAQVLGMDVRYFIRKSSIDQTSAKLNVFTGIGIRSYGITNSLSELDLSQNIPLDQVLFKPEGGTLTEFILNTSINGVQQNQSINIVKIPIGLHVEKPLRNRNNIALHGSFGINGNMVLSNSHDLIESGTVTYSGMANYRSPSGKEVEISLEDIDLEIYDSELKEHSLVQSALSSNISTFGSDLFIDLGATIYNKYRNLGFKIAAGLNYSVLPISIDPIEIQNLVVRDEISNISNLSDQVLLNDFHASIGLVINLSANPKN